MANIMQLVQHLQVGGLEKMALDLCKSSMYSDTTALVSLEGNRIETLEKWPELGICKRLACLDKPSGVNWRTVEKIVNIIDEWDIDVIHSHHIGPMLYAALAKFRRPHIKHVNTLHDAWYLENKRNCFITKAVHRLSKVTFVADAKAVADKMTQTTTINVDQVIKNGVNPDIFQPVSKSTARNKFALPALNRLIGCAARVEEGKGHMTLIKTLKELPNDVHIVFAGDGSMRRSYQAFAEQYGVAHRIHWLGCISDMRSFYSAIDTFCLFSDREGMPLTILESMSCNTPVVASDVGGIKEVINEKTGVVLALDEVNQLPKALLFGMNLKSGNQVRENALQKTDIKLMTQGYDRVYQQLIS